MDRMVSTSDNLFARQPTRYPGSLDPQHPETPRLSRISQVPLRSAQGNSQPLQPSLPPAQGNPSPIQVTSNTPTSHSLYLLPPTQAQIMSIARAIRSVYQVIPALPEANLGYHCKHNIFAGLSSNQFLACEHFPYIAVSRSVLNGVVASLSTMPGGAILYYFPVNRVGSAEELTPEIASEQVDDYVIYVGDGCFGDHIGIGKCVQWDFPTHLR